MITVHMQEDRQGICGFICEGHAGYAAEDEADIICAGVTAVAGTIVSALVDLLALEVTYDFRSGYLFCRLEGERSGEAAAQAELLLRTFELGARQIEMSYGSRYVHVEDMPIKL